MCIRDRSQNSCSCRNFSFPASEKRKSKINKNYFHFRQNIGHVFFLEVDAKKSCFSLYRQFKFNHGFSIDDRNAIIFFRKLMLRWRCEGNQIFIYYLLFHSFLLTVFLHNMSMSFVSGNNLSRTPGLKIIKRTFREFWGFLSSLLLFFWMQS